MIVKNFHLIFICGWCRWPLLDHFYNLLCDLVMEYIFIFINSLIPPSRFKHLIFNKQRKSRSEKKMKKIEHHNNWYFSKPFQFTTFMCSFHMCIFIYLHILCSIYNQNKNFNIYSNKRLSCHTNLVSYPSPPTTIIISATSQ